MRACCGLAQLSEERLRLLAHHEFKAPERRQMVEDLGLKPGNSVLDLGCGIGLWSGWLAQQVEPGGRVVGLDICSQAISVARDRRSSSSFAHLIGYTVADSAPLPFADGCFDLLFCANVMGYFADSHLFLQEMKRVVRIGGTIAVKEIDAGYMVLNPMPSQLMAQIVLALAKLVEHRRRNLNEYSGRVLDFFVGRKLRAYFQSVGLHQIRIRSYVVERSSSLDPLARQHLKGLGHFWLTELGPFLPAGNIFELKELFDE